MNPRIEKLQKESLTAQPYTDIERAKLMTEAYLEHSGKVAGYSNYFNKLNTTLQDEIFSHTEHAVL